jgi:hypothetical protein
MDTLIIAAREMVTVHHALGTMGPLDPRLSAEPKLVAPADRQSPSGARLEDPCRAVVEPIVVASWVVEIVCMCMCVCLNDLSCG